MMRHELVVRLPEWMDAISGSQGHVFADIQDRMRFVIGLARANIDNRTGGPFGAAIFERDSGRLVAVGVNVVEANNCSLLHAEMVAIGFAQQAVGNYDLGAEGLPAHELVTSTEPCAMCLGAALWSGVRRVVCGARGEDAIEIGFDEGDKPADWVGTLEKRRIAVVRDVLLDDARAVLLEYKQAGGVIYNARKGTPIDY